jgi:hypothetical protein
MKGGNADKLNWLQFEKRAVPACSMNTLLSTQTHRWGCTYKSLAGGFLSPGPIR